MKRKAIIVIAAIALALSSCMRDEDLALLRHPIHMQGSVDPSFGAPVAYGHMTLHDIFGMLSSTYTGHIYDTTDIITIYFDTAIADTIKNIIPGSYSGGGTKATFYTLLDTTFEYSVNITLFDGVQIASMMANNNITIGDLWLDLKAILKAIVPDNVANYVNDENNVHSNIDNFHIYYTKHDDTEVEFTEATIPNETLKHLVDGDTMTRTHINLKSIINDMPKRIRVSFHYDFKITDEFLFSLSPADAQAVRDSIQKLRMFYDVNAYAEFPFDIKINRLPYSYNIKFPGDSLPSLDFQQTLDSIARGLSVDVSDAKLSLAFDNGIPMNIDIAAFFKDANGNIIGDTLITNTTLTSAPLTSDGAGHYIANGSTRTVVTVRLDEQRLRDMKNARSLGFKFAIATNNGSNNVSVKRYDFLAIKAYVMVHPQANIDIPLTNQGLIN